MPKWTVLYSEEFDAECKKIATNLKRPIANSIKKHSKSQAVEASPVFLKFKSFVWEMLQLKTKEDTSANLIFLRNDEDGQPLYALVWNGWRCIYHLEVAAGNNPPVCTAVSIDEM